MTDHKRESDKIMDSIHDWQGEQGQTDATLIAAAMDSMRHATLHLAEQQRIANLIALLALEDGPIGSGYSRGSVIGEIRRGVNIYGDGQ